MGEHDDALPASVKSLRSVVCMRRARGRIALVEREAAPRHAVMLSYCHAVGVMLSCCHAELGIPNSSWASSLRELISPFGCASESVNCLRSFATLFLGRPLLLVCIYLYAGTVRRHTS
jgi:hypothetical protein